MPDRDGREPLPTTRDPVVHRAEVVAVRSVAWIPATISLHPEDEATVLALGVGSTSYRTDLRDTPGVPRPGGGGGCVAVRAGSATRQVCRLAGRRRGARRTRARATLAAAADLHPALPVVVVHTAQYHRLEHLREVFQIARASVAGDRPAALARPARSRSLLGLDPALRPTGLAASRSDTGTTPCARTRAPVRPPHRWAPHRRAAG